MEDFKCKECGNPLRVISGGQKTSVDSTKIVTVHIWGCMNPDCKINMQPQNRTETDPQESFE